MYLVGTLCQPIHYSQGALPRDHRPQGVTQLEVVLPEVFHDAICTIDNGKETSAAWMSKIVDLAHYLHNRLVKCDF